MIIMINVTIIDISIVIINSKRTETTWDEYKYDINQN